MSTRDLWVRDIVTYCVSVAILFLTITFFVIYVWRKFAQKFYRYHLMGFEARCDQLAAPHKKELFAELENVTSGDEILRSIGSIRILEIGVKTGGNIRYYPDGAHFIGVDWNTKLRDYLTSSEYSWQFSHVHLERLIIGDGSSLRLIPSDCVDIVVTTRSLCSADSVEDTLSEIRRVLVPGGKYLFLEHVPDTEKNLVRQIQKILTKTKIWPSLYGNCRLDNDPISHIKQAGFKNLTWKSFTLEGHVSQPNHLFLTRHHVIGTAIGKTIG